MYQKPLVYVEVDIWFGASSSSNLYYHENQAYYYESQIEYPINKLILVTPSFDKIFHYGLYRSLSVHDPFIVIISTILFLIDNFLPPLNVEQKSHVVE